MQRATGQCRLDLADQLRADGACELQVKQLLGGRIPQPLKTGHLRPCPRSVGELGQGPSTPQPQRFPGRTRPRPGSTSCEP